MDLGTDRTIDSLNDEGVVVGVEEKPNTPVHGFVISTSSGVLYDLGRTCCHSKMYVAGDGSIIGSFGLAGSGGSGFGNAYHSFRWTLLGGSSDLSVLMDHDQSNDDEAVAMNSSGAIAGTEGNRAYLFRNGVTHYLGSLPGADFSSATGLSVAGHVVGATNDGRCFISKNDRMTAFRQTTDGICNVHAVNSHGHSVGSVGTGSFYRGAVWSDDGSVIADLGDVLPQTTSVAVAINESDQAVGAAGDNAILFSEGKYVPLSDLIGGTIHLRIATSINNKGQIIASGLCSDQLPHALLLTPLP